VYHALEEEEEEEEEGKKKRRLTLKSVLLFVVQILTRNCEKVSFGIAYARYVWSYA